MASGSGQRTADSGRLAPASGLGESLGRHVILGELGTGALGRVYRAYDPRLAREVALKRLPASVLERDGARELLVEAQAMAQLSHPNVVAVYGVENTERGPVLSMECVAGQTLDRWLGGERKTSEILGVFAQAARGLHAAHTAGIIHRDFKPSNVLVGDDGRVRVMDFGFARLGASFATVASLEPEEGEDEEPRASKSTPLGTLDLGASRLVGTPLYMAPEQYDGHSGDVRSDIYTFCLVAREALGGPNPFGTKLRGLIAAKRRGPPAWPRVSRVPRAVRRAISRGLEPRPSERWATLAPIIRTLERHARARGRRWGWVLMAGAVGVASIVAGRWSTRRDMVCSSGPARIERVWNAQREAKIEAAARDTGAVFAQQTAQRVIASLRAHADAWEDAYLEACSTEERSAASQVDLRLACLERRVTQLDAVVSVLEAADTVVLRQAVELVEGLEDPASCTDVQDAGAGSMASDPRAQRVEATLARVDAKFRAGRVEEAREEILRLEREYELDTRPTIAARIHATRAALAEESGAYDEAIEHARLALGGALQSGQPRVAAGAAIVLGRVHGLHRGDVELGEEMARQAAGLYARSGETQSGRVLDLLGALAYARGDWSAAERHYGDAVLHDERESGLRHPSVARSLDNLATVVLARGRTGEAGSLFRRALEIKREALGDEHPDVVLAEIGLAAVAYRAGRLDEAWERYRAAARRVQEVFGERHPRLGYVYVGLGAVHEARREYVDALANFEKARAIFEESSGAVHPTVAMCLTNEGTVATALGRTGRARERFHQAIEMYEAIGGPEHPLIASVCIELGRLELERGHPEDAVDALERAERLRLEGPQEGRGVASVRALLARAHEALGHDERARELAAAALAEYEASKEGESDEAVELRQWFDDRFGSR